ncbi:hypothetical protein BUALT_Bualt06G0125400 [Buddleja alternifolia]|uniref:Uncharacterized protein n=1 Tax=Buddleja alternifolia TaxID=168488 RepID=A0AAV6XMJ2_9LAMI|nr:hypothetical protein BUALT_Bualt06G0125400 [Buddleja alternifolia]
MYSIASHSAASAPAKLSGIASAAPDAAPSSPPPGSPENAHRFNLLPVELGCGESLMPLHSVTASVLLNSKFSANIGH